MSTKDITLKPEVLALSDKIKAGITIDKQTGLGSETSSLYDDNLPESLTPELVAEVSNYNTTFVAAGAFATGNLAVDAMSSNKNLERVTVELGMGGKDSVTFNVDRHKQFGNHLTGGEPTDKYGIVTAGVEVVAGKNAGQLKKARLLVGELALEKLK